MTKDKDLVEIVKRELGNRGYVVRVTTRREGEYVVGRLHVTNAETDETVAKFVGVGNADDFYLCFGLDIEGTVRELVTRTLRGAEDLRNLLPTVIMRAEKR